LIAMSFEDFRKVSRTKDADTGYKLEKVLDTVRDLLETDDNVKIFYPKNLFVDYKSLEIFMLTKSDKIILSRYNWKDEYVEIEAYRAIDIQCISIKIKPCEPNAKKLTIKFKNGNEINFDSIKDANETWQEQYSTSIENISKFLMLRESPVR